MGVNFGFYLLGRGSFRVAEEDVMSRSSWKLESRTFREEVGMSSGIEAGENLTKQS